MTLIDYDLGNFTRWPRRTCSMFPPNEAVTGGSNLFVPRADRMPWEEPYYAHLAKALYEAAGKTADTSITDVDIESVDRDGVRLTLTTEGQTGGLTAYAQCIAPDSTTAARSKADISSGKVSIDLPGPFMTGTHFVWLHLKKDTTDVAWASAGFTVTGPAVTSIATEKVPCNLGDIIKGTVTLRDAPTDARVTVELIDTFGRVTDSLDTAASTNVPFELDSDGVASITARIRATLRTGNRIEAKDSHTVALLRDLPPDDYLVGIWASYANTACARPWAFTLLDKQRRLGVDFALMAHSDADIYHQAYAEHNMAPAPENMHRIFFKLNETYKNMNLAEPGFEDAFREVIRSRAKTGYKWGSLDFSVGDECGYTVRYDKHTVNAFRQYLEKRYNTIQPLNNDWGTAFTSFADITAESIKQSDPAVTIAPMLQFKLFSDRLFADYFRIAREEVQRLDPRNRLGLSGTRDPGHYIGFDWYELMKHVTHLAFYDGLQRECIRSFKKPGDLITSFVGYDFLDLDERNTRYFPWLELFSGFQGISIYSASSGTWHGYIRHDLSWPERAKWTMDELNELKNGIGKSILTAQREPAAIAIRYSQRSLHASSAWLSNVTGICEVIKDMGLQFNFVADEQIEQGLLRTAPCRVLFLPLAQVLSDRETAEITDFVNNGGRLVAVGRCGTYNGAGKVRSANALADILGVQCSTAASTATDNVRVDVGPESLNVPIDDLGITATKADTRAAFQNHTKTPAVTRNVHGRGQAWFVNFLWGSYRGFRSGGVGGEVVDRTTTDEDTAAIWRGLMSTLLEETDIVPPALITRDEKTVPYIEQVVYRRGPITYLGILPRYFGGRYTRGTKRDWIEPQDFAPVTVDVRRETCVYNMREEQFLGRTSTVPARITSGIALLYALTPYQVNSVELTSPPTAKQGDSIDIGVHVESQTQPVGDHIVHLEIVGPDPELSSCHNINLITEAGYGGWTVNLARNAPPGKWTITARDVVSGIQSTADVVVTEK
ncbi:MAG: beta-galactosidase [Candidatus Pacebacteria bacterium]|nr:beta-galactosidase [Candidatus Paceibacterota bacterium]